MTTIFACAGALVLIVTAAYHLTGLREIGAGLDGERRSLIRAAWICVAVDWLLIAGAWLAAAAGVAPPGAFAFGAAIALAAAGVLAATSGPTFPGVWLLAAAGGCGLLAAAM